MDDDAEQFQHALLSLDRLSAKRIVSDAARSLSPIELIDTIIARALRTIGESWERGDTALAEVYMSGRICEELVNDLLPPGDPDRKDHPPMAIAVLDDYHSLGKRIVYCILRAGGYDLQDYGRVTVDEVILKVKNDRIRILLLSTLMLHSALHVRDVVAGLKAQNLDVKVVVGGAPFLFDTQLWQEVNANAMGRSAADVIGIIQTLTGGIS